MEDVPVAGERTLYRFAGFVFDPTTGELESPRGDTRLPPKAARLLALLLARPGELVSREALRQELWPDQHVELDQVLAYTVRQVRAALGDDGAEPRFVETLPRRGYRFLGAVESSSGPLSPRRGERGVGTRGAAERQASGPPGARALARPWGESGVADQPRGGGRVGGGSGLSPRGGLVRGRAVALLAATVALAALAALAIQRRGQSAGGAGTPGEPLRLALLPLGEHGRDLDNDLLTDGLVVALTAQPGVELVGPATTARWRGTTRPHPELGRELGVTFVVSGGYRPHQQLLFLQLVRVTDGKHVFAHGYRGPRQAVEGQLAAAAAAIVEAARQAPSR